MKNKGITLIVLVITILIILILSVVVIMQLTGENGLVTIVNKTKKAQIKSEMKEQLIISELQIENGSVQFYYDKGEKNGKKVDILIHIQDSENGLEKIELPEKDAIIVNGRKKEIGIDYEVEIGKEYKIKITSGNGKIIEKIIYIEPEIEITEPIIATTPTATTSVSDVSQVRGTILYISFSAVLEGSECTIVNKNDNKPIPYQITKNGKYTFVVTGTYQERTIEKEIEIMVNKYQAAAGIVQYDAGEWTKEEIEELENLKLYDVNPTHTMTYNRYKLKDSNGLTFTFGGFTYNGSEDEGTEGVITSRNQSVNPMPGRGTPKYSGWQIFESKDENDKTYVSKIIHAGCPENFTANINVLDDDKRASYLLSDGKRFTDWNILNDGKTEINPRNFDMYKDKSKLEMIEEVHLITYDEYEYQSQQKNYLIIEGGGSYYFVVGREPDVTLYRGYGGLASDFWRSECIGIRPVVTMVSGVYIKSGNGTEADPYILGKD